MNAEEGASRRFVESTKNEFTIGEDGGGGGGAAGEIWKSRNNFPGSTGNAFPKTAGVN